MQVGIGAWATCAFLSFATTAAAQPSTSDAGVDVAPPPLEPVPNPVPDTAPDPPSDPAPDAAPGAATDPAYAPARDPAPAATPAPSPRPSPPSADAPVFVPQIEVFAEYGFTWTHLGRDTEWSHAFELARVHVGLGASWHGVRATTLVEAVRSSGRGAILGVAGDSLVIRAREAWLGYLLAGTLDLGAGLVPTLTIRSLDALWTHRIVGASALEATGLSSPADLGVRATLRLPRAFGTVGAAAYAGEGYTSRDLNRGKSTELFAAVRPLAGLGSLRPFSVVLAYVIGSTGTSSARANRLTGALAWDAPRVGGGVAFHYAWGVAGDGSQDGWVLEGFARAEPIERVLLAVRASRFARDVDVSDDTYDELHAAVGFRVAPPLELFLALDRTVPGDASASALPGADAWTLRLAARGAIGP